MVKLEGITNSLSHNDMNTAVEKFGKTKSFVLFRSKQQVPRKKSSIFLSFVKLMVTIQQEFTLAFYFSFFNYYFQI